MRRFCIVVIGFAYTLFFVSSILFERAFLFAPLILSLIFIIGLLAKPYRRGSDRREDLSSCFALAELSPSARTSSERGFCKKSISIGRPDPQKSLVHVIVFFVSLIGLLSESTSIIKLYPFLASTLIFGVFTYLTLSKKSILSAGFKRFSKKRLTPEFEEFLYGSQYFWIGVLGLNIILHLYFYTQDEIIWASYALFGWYILLFVALLLNIAYGRLNSIKRFETI